jgi:hypothetical protein
VGLFSPFCNDLVGKIKQELGRVTYTRWEGVEGVR